VKSSDVTPNDFVSKAPRVEPVKDPPFSTLIRVANSVASTPCTSNTKSVMHILVSTEMLHTLLLVHLVLQCLYTDYYHTSVMNAIYRSAAVRRHPSAHYRSKEFHCTKITQTAAAECSDE